MKTKLIGIGLLLAVIIAAVCFKAAGKPSAAPVAPPTDAVALKGYLASEKEGLFNNADFQSMLKKKYGITLDYMKAGSLQMVQADTKGVNFLFPSSQVPLDMYKAAGKPVAKSDTIFNSPLVLYSWADVTDALVSQNIAAKTGDAYFVTDMPKLINMVIEGKKWSDIGLKQIYGSMTVITTDPTKSNSGNQFAGLAASLLNGGQVVDEATVDRALPKLKEFYAKLGYLNESSGDVFQQYLKTGEGAKPIIVGYESQMIEFAKQNPEAWNQLKGKIRVLYPIPTVWSSHPLIATDAKGARLVTALQDKEIQAFAWENYGFRSGVVGVRNDVKNVPVSGTPADIEQVIPMPASQTMQKITDSLR